MVFIGIKWEHRATPHICSWLELVMSCGERLKLPRGEALNQVLKDKLEWPGRGEGEENGISSNRCAHTEAWRKEFDGHCKWLSMDGV